MVSCRPYRVIVADSMRRRIFNKGRHLVASFFRETVKEFMLNKSGKGAIELALFAEFVMSAAAPRQFLTDNLPEIALVGRSNVGKSSMINSLLKMSKLARTSNTPGRTQTLNFYRIWPEGRPRNADAGALEGGEERFSLRGSALEAARATGAFYFVDMPGYGFAKVSESQKESWRTLIEQYLVSRENLKAVIQIVDLRHPPSKDDVVMWRWLGHSVKSALCLATKADKVPKSQRSAHLDQIRRDLSIRPAGPPSSGVPPTTDPDPLLMYSAEEGLGRDGLWPWVIAASRS